MTSYRLVGAPYGSDRPAIEEAIGENLDRVQTGHVFDADLSEEQEKTLVGAGAIQRVEDEEDAGDPDPEPDPEPEPQPEPQPEPGPEPEPESGSGDPGPQPWPDEPGD